VTPAEYWLIIYGFTSRSRIFHLYGDDTIAGEGLQNLGLCSALKAFEPHLLWHGTSVFPISFKGPSHSVASFNTRGDVEKYSNPDPHGVRRLLTPGSFFYVEMWPPGQYSTEKSDPLFRKIYGLGVIKIHVVGVLFSV
jgi:hypothetical protein